MRISRPAFLLALLSPLAAQTAPDEARIVTASEVEQAIRPRGLLPLRILSFPHRKVTGGMERGLIAFERGKVLARYRAFTENLRSHGIEYRFGGSGEGSGIGGGGAYTLHLGERQVIQSLGLITFKNYQEFGLQWRASLPHAALIAEASYQWRPQENFYGLGHDSKRFQHSTFALRQTWAGLRWEMTARRRLRWGVLHKWVWASALPGRNPVYAVPETYFSSLAGYGTQTRLQTTGAYFDLDGIRAEYQLGGAAHFGASRQEGLGRSRLNYFTYETQIEGRLPVLARNSALVGQANFEFNRTRAGSDAIPFYLLPHIGGSSTLRGFALDRFYGLNLALLSLEYRYRVHPNVQAYPFFDEGQIFDRTSELSWLNWHRNYGFGFRFRSVAGTFLRIEYGRGAEGFQLHIMFGERERPPLSAPVRFGAYRR